MTKYRVKFFGAFREWIPAGSIEIQLVEGATVGVARAELRQCLSKFSQDGRAAELLGDSVIADQDSTLEDDSVLPSGVELAVLPPVCGG